MYKELIKRNVTSFAIILFIIVFSTINLYKPSFLFKSNGSLREFGIGYKNKTILPLWLLSIILGIICYISILYYVTFSGHIRA